MLGETGLWHHHSAMCHTNICSRDVVFTLATHMTQQQVEEPWLGPCPVLAALPRVHCKSM